MHPKQDRIVPPRLPKDLEEQFHAADKEIQDIIESGKSLRRDWDQAIKSGDRVEADRIVAALEQIRRRLCARKATVSRHNQIRPMFSLARWGPPIWQKVHDLGLTLQI